MLPHIRRPGAKAGVGKIEIIFIVKAYIKF